MSNWYPPPPPPSERYRRPSFDRSLRKSYWLWRANPALMVPTLLTSSISALAQSVYVVFGTILLAELEANGTLPRLVAALVRGNTSGLVTILFSHAILILFVEYMGAAGIISAIVALIASAYASSAEYICYLRAMGNEKIGITTIFSAMKLKWKPMVRTIFIMYLLMVIPFALPLAVFGAFFISSSPALLTLFLTTLLVASIVSAVILVITMYSLIVVALEDLSGTAAVFRSYGIVSKNVKLSLVYMLVAAAAYFGISIVAELATTVGVPLTSLASIAITLLVIPVLHLTKTQIYVQAREPNFQREPIALYNEISGTKDLLGGPFFLFALRKLKQGIIALKDFALNLRNIPYHFASALCFLFGVWIGLDLGSNGLDQAILALGYEPGYINPTILSAVPLTEGFDIFLHNWDVSLSTALAGMWLIAPSLLTLAFNGMVLGVVYHLTPNFTMFAAAIFPHGSIEIPSFVLAGSAGMRLGVAFIRSLGKSWDSPEQRRLEFVARETIYIVIGLAILFLIAGTIEGNITPQIMKLYGWKTVTQLKARL